MLKEEDEEGCDGRCYKCSDYTCFNHKDYSDEIAEQLSFSICSSTGLILLPKTV